MLKEEQKNRQVKIMFETNKEGKQVVAAGSASDLLSSLIDKEYIGKWLLHHIDITYF
jgi:cell wall assembly regulator SMI1